MKRSTILLLALVLALPTFLTMAWANAPVLVRRDGTIVNLDTGVAIHPDGSRTVLSHASLALLIAHQRARIEKMQLAKTLHHHQKPR